MQSPQLTLASSRATCDGEKACDDASRKSAIMLNTETLVGAAICVAVLPADWPDKQSAWRIFLFESGKSEMLRS